MQTSFLKDKKILINGGNGKVGKRLFSLMQGYNLSHLDFDTQVQADIIFHLVATTESSKIIDSNINYLDKVIEYAKKNNIQKIVFFSSMSIYGEQNRFDVDEDTNPINPSLYGLSKLFGEKLLQNSDLEVLILRLPAVMTKNSDAFIAKIFGKLEQNKDVFLTNYHKNFNSLITVEDIVKFIELYDFRKKFEVVNLAIESNQTLFDIVTFYKEMIGSSSNIFCSDEVSGFYNVSIQKALNEYNFVPFDYKTSLKITNETRLKL